MLELALVAVVCAVCGFTARAVDPHRSSYGLLLPAGLSVSLGLLLWILLAGTPVSYTPGRAWLTWLLPMSLGLVVSASIPLTVGRRRSARDIEKLDAILRG